MAKVFRQGDVVIEEIDSLPEGYTPSGETEIRMTGETGNAHVLQGRVFVPPRGKTETILVDKQPVIVEMPKIVEVGTGGALITHPEHPVLKVPPGLYKARKLRIYAYTKDQVKIHEAID